MIHPKKLAEMFETFANDATAFQNYVNEHNSSLSITDFANQTLAHIAVRNDDVKMLRKILDKEPSLVNVRDKFGFTVLHRATDKSSLATVKCLVEDYKADIYQKVNELWGNSALHTAASANNLDVVKYFIEDRGVDPALKNIKGQSAAFSAAVYKHIDVIKYLVEWRKLDVTQPDVHNDTILFLSVRMRDVTIPKYLLDDRKLQFDINHRGNLGRPLLYWAARVPRMHFIEYFVEDKNADVNIADDRGSTPLHSAVEVGNLKVVRYLLKHKAKIDAEDMEGRKPVDIVRATNADTIAYLKMRMRGRGRRSIPKLTHRPTSLPSMNSPGKISLVGSTVEVNSSSLWDFLMVADLFIRKVRATHHTPLTHRSLWSPQEIIHSKMDPLVMEAIKGDLY